MDATIIEAPSSTKNRAGERDPEMHQTKKGNQWHFGMKAHIGVDADTGIVHSMSATAANAHDVTQVPNLLHGGEKVVWGDAGYQGVHKRRENLGLSVEWLVAMRPGRRRTLEPGSEEALEEKAKASVRAKSLPPTAIGGGASVPEAEAFVWIQQGALPGSGEERGAACAVVRAGQPADDGGSTVGVVRVTVEQRRSQGRIKPPTAQSGAKLNGLSTNQQAPTRSSHPLHNSVKHNPDQNGLVQSILNNLTCSCRSRPHYVDLLLRRPVDFCRFVRQAANPVRYLPADCIHCRHTMPVWVCVGIRLKGDRRCCDQ